MSRCAYEHTHKTRTDRCPACGHTPQAASILARDLQRAEQSKDSAPDFCAKCGSLVPLASKPLEVVPTGESVNSPMEADIARSLAENFSCGHYNTWKFDTQARMIGLITRRHAEQAFREVTDSMVESAAIAQHAKDREFFDTDEWNELLPETRAKLRHGIRAGLEAALR